MTFRVGSVLIKLSPLFFILFAYLTAIDKTSLTVISIASSVLHELGHLAIMERLSYPPNSIEVSPFGIEINYMKAPAVREKILISIVGPLANFIVVSVFIPIYILTKSELCINIIAVNSLIFIINLLPICGLDGGDILFSILLCKYEYITADKASKAVGYISAIMFSLVSVYFLIKWGSISALILSVYLLILNLFKL